MKQNKKTKQNTFGAIPSPNGMIAFNIQSIVLFCSECKSCGWNRSVY